MSDAAVTRRAAGFDGAIAANQEVGANTPTSVAGDALLDARVDMSQQPSPEGGVVENPIVTNASGGSSDDAKTAGVSTTSGPHEAEQEEAEGKVNLRNNPNVLGNELRGQLPDTDPIQLPNDASTNLLS